MRANKHLLLWSSVATLLMLFVAIYRENYGMQWRQLQQEYRDHMAKAGKPTPDIKLRQVVVPKLKVADRCVSCHVGMAPGESGVVGHAVFAPHPKVVHDPNKFGCTVCHSGQGRATVKADAHGTSPHWPEPMIPLKHAYAGCGSCHTHIYVPSQQVMTRGRQLLEQYDCLSCHRVDGRGGTQRPLGKGGMEGLDLSTVGAKGFDRRWYADHLAKATGAEPTKKAAVWKAAFGKIPAAQRRTIESYLYSRVGIPKLVKAKALFNSLGCRGCHKINGVGGDDGPDLTLFGKKDPAFMDYSGVYGKRTLENWIVQHFHHPARVVQSSKMPRIGLTDEQVELLTLYMLSLRLTSYPEAFWPPDRARVVRLGQREFSDDGASLYGVFCAACHGPRGQGQRYPGMGRFPGVANPGFLSVASDAFIRQTLIKGRPGRRMPAWGSKSGGLSKRDIRTIIAYLRKLGGGVKPKPDPKPARWVKGSPSLGSALYSRSCSQCHGSKGQGGTAPSLANAAFGRAATDTFLVETISRGRRGTSMSGFGRGSILRKALSDYEIQSIVVHIRSWNRSSKRKVGRSVEKKSR